MISHTTCPKILGRKRHDSFRIPYSHFFFCILCYQSFLSLSFFYYCFFPHRKWKHQSGNQFTPRPLCGKRSRKGTGNQCFHDEPRKHYLTIYRGVSLYILEWYALHCCGYIFSHCRCSGLVGIEKCSKKVIKFLREQYFCVL